MRAIAGHIPVDGATLVVIVVTFAAPQISNGRPAIVMAPNTGAEDGIATVVLPGLVA